jgi:hypothetical protein
MILKEKILTSLIVLVVLTGIPATEAMAQEPAAPTWEFAFIPYGWSTGINGEVTVDGTTRRVEASASDLADIRDTGVSFVFTARKDNWGFLLDNVWASYSDNPSPDERVQTDVLLLDGNVSTSLGGAGPLELLAGFRYYNIDSSLMWAGYRYLNIDYNNNDFALDIALSGFSLGFGFHF